MSTARRKRRRSRGSSYFDPPRATTPQRISEEEYLAILRRVGDGLADLGKQRVRESLDRAKRQVDAFLNRIPASLRHRVDREAYYGEAGLAVWEAAKDYDPQRGWSYKTFACQQVNHALLDERRRQDHLSRDKRDAVTVARAKQSRGEPLTGWELELLEEDGQGPRVVCSADIVSEEPDPEPQMHRAMEQAWLQNALDRLEPEEREAVRLRYVEEMDWREMEQVTGKGKWALSRITRTALERLRGFLSEGECP